MTRLGVAAILWSGLWLPPLRHGFEAEGTVRLTGTTINGDLVCELRAFLRMKKLAFVRHKLIARLFWQAQNGAQKLSWTLRMQKQERF